MQLSSEFSLERSTGFEPLVVWKARNRAPVFLRPVASICQVVWLSARFRLRIVSLFILWLVAAMATGCLAQDFTPPPGPSNNPVAPGIPILPDQPPNPGPVFPILQDQQPRLGPGFPIPQNQQPSLGVPTVEPGFWPPTAASEGTEPPAISVGPSPDAQGRSNDAGLPDEMVGSGGMGGFRGGMNPVDSVRYSVLWFPRVPVQG